MIAQEGAKSVIVEVNSETDFVAKDENFVAFAEAVAALALSSGLTDVEAISAEKLSDGRSVEEARTELIQKVGENIGVRRIESVAADGVVASYSHGARIGVVVALEGGDENLAHDIAMHVAAMNPQYISEADVPADTLERERRILTEQAQDSGKPAEIIEKMVTGRVNKFLKEITLLGQPFVKDDSLTVGKLLSGANASIAACVRFEVGEGIEKKEDNFVEEVMAQVKGAS